MTWGETVARVPTTSPPIAGRSAGCTRSASKRLLADRDPAHHRDADQGRKQPESARGDEVVRDDAGGLGRDDAELHRRQRPGDEIADQCRDPDRRQARGRVIADDQLESVERAGKGRAKGAGDAGGGPAADQDTQVAAAQAERPADARSEAARQLGVARLEADRCADAARPHGFGRHDEAADQRHATAPQGVRLDRIDLATRAPFGNHETQNAERNAAQERNGEGHARVERDAPGKALARL